MRSGPAVVRSDMEKALRLLALAALVSVGCGSAAVAPPIRPALAWRSERFADLRLEARVFADAPTNTALYVRQIRLQVGPDLLTIEIDDDPTIPPIYPLIPQLHSRSGQVEPTTVCDRPARRLVVDEDGVGSTPPRREVRVEWTHARRTLLVTWQVDAIDPSRYAAAERAFFASIRCW